MYVNLTGKAFYLDADGKLVESDNPNRATLLVAPDGQLADDLVRKHGLQDTLTSTVDVVYVNEATGEEYVHREGRAVAAHLVAEPPTNRTVLKPRLIVAEGKMVAGPAENKAVPGVTMAPVSFADPPLAADPNPLPVPSGRRRGPIVEPNAVVESEKSS